MYSAPSIVLQSRGQDGSVHVFDDFRESYAWLRQNTAEDAKVRSESRLGAVSECRLLCWTEPTDTKPFACSLGLTAHCQCRLPVGGIMATRPQPWQTGENTLRVRQQTP